MQARFSCRWSSCDTRSRRSPSSKSGFLKPFIHTPYIAQVIGKVLPKRRKWPVHVVSVWAHVQAHNSIFPSPLHEHHPNSEDFTRFDSYSLDCSVKHRFFLSENPALCAGTILSPRCHRASKCQIRAALGGTSRGEVGVFTRDKS